MSEVIDSRIVEMRFDNSQFESNVRESMKTIDNLKSSLNFEDSVKGLDKIKVDIDASGAVQGLNAISDAAGDCDLSQISDSAESVKLSFSALEVVAVTALGKIASAAIDAGAKAVNAFAIQPITDGFAEYNQQLKSTRVITSNTGQSLEEVTAVLDDLNEYADKTIYSFGDMTQAMGYFTSALGKDSAEASSVIARGISNWAASTGQGNEVAKRVMYQVSQALSTGVFRLQDWKSIENTGAMAGARYQEAFIQTAAEMYGTTYEEFNAYIEQEYGSFRESLTKGEWLTNEVFLNTMLKFANMDGSGAFQWMEDAATKVLTFSDLLATVREQLGTGWGETWKIVFGNYEQSIEFFTGISKSIGNFITDINNARNAIFQGWSDKGGRALLFGISEQDTGAIGLALDGILELLSQVHEAFIDAFGSEFISDLLMGATVVIYKLADAFNRLAHIPILHTALRSVFSILRSILDILGNLYQVVEPFLDLALFIVENILNGLSGVAEVIANVIDKISMKVSSLAEKITAPFKIASDFITGVFAIALDFVSGKISSLWNWLKKFDVFGIMGDNFEIDASDGSSLDETQQEVDQLSAGLEAVNDGLQEVEDTSKNISGHKVSITVDGLQAVNDNLVEAEENTKELTNTWWDLVSESDKNRYFAAQYWNDLTDEQKENWKQAALGLKLFTEEELRQFESSEKTVSQILNERNRITKRKKDEAQTWWDLISESDKQQYFAGQYWDDLTDEQREAWRKRAEEYQLYDPEEYARLLAEMDAAEQAAFSLENTEEIAESTSNLEKWFETSSKIPIIGGFLEKFGWVATKTVKNAKSFASAVGTSFGGFFNYVKELNGTDYAFSQKFGMAAKYFKENVSDYLGQLVVKNFKSVGEVISNTPIIQNLSTFASNFKDRLVGFKDYVVDINKNSELTFPEKFKLSLDYFKTNVVDYLGQLVGGKFKELISNFTNNKIVSNLVSFTSAAKTKFGEFRDYVTELNANTELTFPEKLQMSLTFLKENVVDYFLELINKNLKSLGIDIEKIGKDISQALTNAATFIDNTLKSLGINTDELRKFFWNDDGTLKSIPDIITELGNKIEEAYNNVKKKLRGIYENFFPSNENGELTGPLGWLANLKSKVNEFISSIFGSEEDLENAEGKASKGGLLQGVLGVLGFAGGSSLVKSVGGMNSLFALGSKGISGSLNFGKIAIGVALAAGAFGLLSKIDFSKIGIDFKGFTDYFKDGEGNLLPAADLFAKVGESISNSKLGTFVSSVGSSFKENFGFFTESLKTLNDPDLTFPEKFRYAFQFFKEQFLIPFGESTKENLKIIGIDIDGFLANFKNKEGDWLSIGEFFKNAGTKIFGGIEELKTKFENTQIGAWISGKFQEFKALHPEITKFFDSFGESISKFTAPIGNIAQVIGRNVSTAFNLLKDKIAYFKVFIDVLNESDLSFPEKFRLAFQFFKEQFVEPFGELAKKNLKTIGIDIDAFVNFFKNNEGNWMSIGDIIKKIGDKIHNSFSELKAKFEQSDFGKWITDKLEWIKNKFSGLSEWLGNFSSIISHFAIPVIGGVGIFLVLRQVGQLFDVIASIGQFFSGRTPLDRANAFSIRAEALANIIKSIAVSVVMIAGALAGLAMLNQDELGKAADNLVKILSQVVRVAIAFSVASVIITIIRSRNEDAKEFSTTLLELAGTMFLMSAALKLITTLPFDDFGKLAASFGVLAALMVMVIAFARFTPKLEGSRSTFIGMVGIATAVLEMVGALYLVQLMIESHQGIGWALLTLFGIVGTFALLCTAAKGINWRAGLGLVLMANSVRTMISALERVVDSDLLTKFREDPWENLLKIVAVFGSLALLAGINRLAGGGRAGMSLFGVAASVWILVQAIEQIADIREDRLWAAVGVVSVLSVVMGAILVCYSRFNNGNGTSLRSMIATTVQLYSVVIGVILLCAAVAVLSTIEQTQLITAGAVVFALTFVVGAIATLMAALSRKAHFGNALGLLVSATGVAVAMGALIWALDHYIPDKSNLWTIVGSVSALTVVVGLLAGVFGSLRLRFVDLGEVAGVFATMAGVVAVVGLILTLISNNFPKDFDNDKIWTIVGAVSALSVLIGVMAWFFGTVANGLHMNNPAEALGIFAMMAVVVAAAGAILTLVARNFPTDMDSEKLWRIVEGITVLTTIIGALALIFGTIPINLASAFQGALALGLFGLVIEALIALAGIIYGWQGENIENVVSIIERIGKGLLKMFDGLMSTIGKLNWWQLVAVIGVTAAAVAAAGAFGLPIAVGLAAIIGIVGLVVEVLITIAALIYSWQGDNIEKVVSLIGRAGRGFAEIFDSIMTSIGKLSWQQLLATVVLFSAVIGQIAYLAPTIGLSMGIFAVEMAIAAAVIVGIFDFTLPLFEKFANDGIPIFEKIASGIVQIASIIINGIVSNVETIVECLRDFSDFAANDFDADKVGQAVNVASQLTEVISAFVGDSFLDALGRFIAAKYLDETNRNAFVENVGCLTTVLNVFKANASTWQFADIAKTSMAVGIAKQLTDVCNAFTEDNLISAYSRFLQETWFGYEYRQAFVDNITTLGTAINTFCTTVGSVPSFDIAKAALACTIADKMIDLIKKFAPDSLGEAIWQWFSSSMFNAETIKGNITNLSDAVTTFCDAVEKWIIPADYEAKFQIVDKLIEFVNKMPELTMDSGLMDIGDFGESVKTFCESFIYATYYLNSALSKSAITDYDSKMEVIDDLINLTNRLPRVTSAMQKLVDFNITQTLGQFGTDVATFGENLKTFAETMNNVPKINNWEEASLVIDDLIAFAKKLPNKNSVGEELFGYDLNTTLGNFGTEVANFASGFKLAVDSINKIDIQKDTTLEKFGQMIAMVNMLSDLAKELPQSFTQSDASGESSMITSTFTQSLSDFIGNVLGDKDFFGGNYSNTIFDQVNKIYDEIDNLGEFSEDRKNKLTSLVGEDGILQKLSDFAQNLPEITADTTTLSTFGVEIYELANHVTEAIETLNGDDTGGVYKFDPQPLKDMAGGIQGVIDAFSGISTENLGHISSIMDSIATLKSANGNDGSLIGDFFGNMVSSLFGIPNNEIAQATTNVGSMSGLLGDLGSLGTLLNGVIPEGGIDTTSLSTLFGSFDSTTNTFGGGGILEAIPTDLSAFITDMPTSEDLSASTSSLTTMFSGITADSFDFSNLSPLLGNFTAGTGFDDTGFLSMMPVEIQKYLTDMKVPDADIEGVNTMITNLVTGVQQAGSITPELSTNFNTTLEAFATNGITAYTNAFNTEEVNKQLSEAGASIITKTGKGISDALAVLPNEIQTSANGVVTFISDILSGDSSNPYDAPGKPILDKTGSGITLALSNSSQALKTAVKKVVEFIVNILSGNESDQPYNAPGGPIITKTAAGITSALNGGAGGQLKSAAKSVVTTIANVLSGSSESPNPYTNAGNNVITGFVAGMSDTQSVYQAAYEVGRRAVEGLSAAINSNSPSKEAMKYGEYFSEGFGIGIDSYGEVIRSTSEDIGLEALLGLSSYVGEIYDLLDSDLDFNPSITPVLDLSEIQNGVGLIDAMFSRQQAYSTNMEVQGALQARAEAMSPVSTTTDNSRNFGGFTFNIYTQGTDANAIAKQIGVEVSKRLRATGSMI